MQSGKDFSNIVRWYKFIQSRPEVSAAITTMPKDVVIKPAKLEDTKVFIRRNTVYFFPGNLYVFRFFNFKVKIEPEQTSKSLVNIKDMMKDKIMSMV